jgi:hypothetical protein
VCVYVYVCIKNVCIREMSVSVYVYVCIKNVCIREMSVSVYAKKCVYVYNTCTYV